MLAGSFRTLYDEMIPRASMNLILDADCSVISKIDSTTRHKPRAYLWSLDRKSIVLPDTLFRTVILGIKRASLV